MGWDDGCRIYTYCRSLSDTYPTHNFLAPAKGKKIPPGVAVSVSLAALSMAEERSLLPSEGSSRGPRGGGRAIEDGRVEEALVGVHARTRARGSRDEESVMLKLIKLGEMCTIVQSADTRIFVQVTFAFASSRARAMFAVSRQLAAPPFSLPLNLQCPKTRSHSHVFVCPLHRSPAHRARARRALLTLVPPPATRCPSRTREWCGRARWAATSAWSASRCPRRSSPRP